MLSPIGGWQPKGDSVPRGTKKPTKRTIEILELCAKLRWEGHTWADVGKVCRAKKLTKAKDLKDLCRAYPKQWKKIYEDARTDALTEHGPEPLLTHRDLIRFSLDKIAPKEEIAKQFKALQSGKPNAVERAQNYFLALQRLTQANTNTALIRLRAASALDRQANIDQDRITKKQAGRPEVDTELTFVVKDVRAPKPPKTKKGKAKLTAIK
jgi:hypothetical protein